MARGTDLALTAFAPAVWGSTYIVTTELLPAGYPLTVAMLRVLPAGLLLLLFVRKLPSRAWLGRVVLLGALNIALFMPLLFVAAYRLPGGVAATCAAVQPLMVIFLAAAILKTPVHALSIVAAVAGLGGVMLLVLTPAATLDAIGIAAGLGGALSMAAGTVLSRRWRPPVSLLTFTAWQLTVGGLLLLPVALWLEPSLPMPDAGNVVGFVFLGLVGTAVAYALWFRGIGRIEPSVVATLGFMSPVTALVLGWAVLDQSMTLPQSVGVVIVLASVGLSQIAVRRAPSRPLPAAAVGVGD